MSTLPTVILRPGEADRIISGHPWIYAGSILRLTAPVADGGLVQVKDHRQRFLGTGFYNSRSKIHVRLLSADRIEVTEQYFQEAIRSALALRTRHLPGATSFRVVNAESDFLSGLIVDKYEDVLVLQTSSFGMDQRKSMVVEALKTIFSPRAIVEKSDASFRKFEGLEEANGPLFGTVSGSVAIRLNGLLFNVDIATGHKTGLYLDQQTNYERVARVAHGQALDCFTFLGGFALHLARNPAVAHVHALDQSEEAISAAGAHASINGLAARCSFETVNVFDWLKAQTIVQPHEKVVPKFDTIILDPPSFTRSRSTVGDALRGYKEIHLRALKLLRPGGTLATFCCSHHVDATLFQKVILEAAFDARRVLRRIETLSQSPDHPILPSIPETEYLKGFVFELAR